MIVVSFYLKIGFFVDLDTVGLRQTLIYRVSLPAYFDVGLDLGKVHHVSIIDLDGCGKGREDGDCENFGVHLVLVRLYLLVY